MLRSASLNLWGLIGPCGLIGVLGLAAQAALAEPQPVTGHAIRETFSGSTIRLDTPLAATVPIHYHDNGQVTGEAGNLSWLLGSATDKGRWWVEKDRLCHKWNTWFEAENQCLRLRQEGDRLIWVRDDGKTGTATLISKPQPPPVQTQAFASMLPIPSPAVPSPYRVGAPPSQSVQLSTTAFPAAPPPPPKTAPAQVATLTPPSKSKQTPPAKPATTATAPSPFPPKQPNSTTSSVVMVPTFMVSGVDEDDVLYVREGPSSDHASIGALPPQAQGVKILGVCQQEWCPVAHNGVKGWVNTYYLVAENPPTPPHFAQSERQNVPPLLSRQR